MSEQSEEGSSEGEQSPAFESGEAQTSAEVVVDRLGELYWQDNYGGKDAFESLVRTVLSHSTNDKVAKRAYDTVLEKYAKGKGTDRDWAEDSSGSGLVKGLAATNQSELEETISNVGLYHRKAKTITGVAERIIDEHGGGEQFHKFVRQKDYDTVRETLLDLNGVGPKTADCILLFSAGRDGVFPVDTHVDRIYRRLGIAPADADQEAVREVLERDVPGDKCGFAHIASIQFGREYCSARKPACLDDPEACPLGDMCEQVGVVPDSGEVIDPADASEAN